MLLKKLLFKGRIPDQYKCTYTIFGKVHAIYVLAMDETEAKKKLKKHLSNLKNQLPDLIISNPKVELD